MGRLTTHVLDTMSGKPAADVLVRLMLPGGGHGEPLRTNADGRVDSPLAEGDAFVSGIYELHFGVGDYFRGLGIDLPEPAFLDEVVIRVGIAEPDRHYHVPLLVSPFGYSTYRGS